MLVKPVVMIMMVMMVMNENGDDDDGDDHWAHKSDSCSKRHSESLTSPLQRYLLKLNPKP